MGKSKHIKLSKFLCVVLRHDPSAAGISLNEHGWAKVDELIAGVSGTHRIDREILEEIVRTDDKGRYSFNSDGTMIRANHGHSIEVDLELAAVQPPEYLLHGTGDCFVPSIDRKGLLHGERMYVHLTESRNMAVSVGARHGRPVLYRVHSGAMARDGYLFYRSASNVWLCEHVPIGYLEKLTEEDA